MIKNKLTFSMLLLAGLLLFASGCPQSGKEPAATGGTPAPGTTSQTASPGNTPAVGWTGNAKDFTYTKYDGSSAKMSAFAGKPLVLNFWGTW